MSLEPDCGASAWSRHLPWLSAAWTAAGTVLYLLWPALAPELLPLCLAMPVLWCWRSHQPIRLFGVTGVSTVLLIAVCYALINASWSMARLDAYAYAAMLIVILLTLHIGLGAWPGVLNRHAIAAMTIGFYLGFVLASALLCHEILTNQTIFFRLNSLWQPEMRYVSAGGLPPYFLNHRMAALAMLFWPAALAGFSLPVTGWWRWALFAGLTPALVAVAASEHATSKAALIFGTCVVLAGLWSSRMTRRVLMVVWAIACVAVVPLCLAAYAGNLHRQAWLASSARHRVVIWKATSDLILEAPVLGAGIHSGRSIDRAEVGRKLAPGTEYFLSVSWHSHNAYLQVWFEAGAVGAAILLCLGLVTLRRIGGLEQVAQPFLLATFASCATISATGFSSFSPWLSASFALCAMFAALVRAQLRADAQLAAATGQLSRSRAPV